MISDLFNNLRSYPKRLLHVLQVANTAKMLAIKYNVNSEDAYLAGLLHDYAKYNNIDFFNKYISEEEFSIYSNNFENYHAISAANYLQTNYKINTSIYNAIYYHVYGRVDMSLLEKIIFVSDSIYLNGRNNSRYIYVEALKDLDSAIVLALEMTFDHLGKEIKPNNFQIETYNYYKKGGNNYDKKD